jgi:ABC-type Zn2+ transport system substrate-binding protein/surface adhesin
MITKPRKENRREDQEEEDDEDEEEEEGADDDEEEDDDEDNILEEDKDGTYGTSSVKSITVDDPLLALRLILRPEQRKEVAILSSSSLSVRRSITSTP